MRTEFGNTARQPYNDEIIDNTAARRWRGLDLGEAFRSRPHRDDAASVEAMGNHFDPDPTGWRWLSDDSRTLEDA